MVEGLSHRYRDRQGGAIEVLREVCLEVPEGDYVVLIGPSGSGKTTLLSILGGLDHPQCGRVEVCGEDLASLSGDGMAAFRSRTVGFVFQHFGLLEALTAAENVELALMIAGGRSRRHRRGRSEELLVRVGLGDRLDHRPSQLSGGERQRVAVARALANEPRLILADEPTGNLDDESAQVIGDLLESLRSEDGRTLVVVTHHHVLAERAEHGYRISDHRLVPLQPPALRQAAR